MVADAAFFWSPARRDDAVFAVAAALLGEETRGDAIDLVARRFAAQAREQEALHARLRQALLARAHEPLPASLPEASTAGLVALVALGRDRVGRRALSGRDLGRLLMALGRVSRRAPARRERITHVLLHGWLAPDELALLARALDGEPRLCRLPDGGYKDEAAAQSMPLLALLQRRYRDALLALGVASPLLDAAALVGIPSFQLQARGGGAWRPGDGDDGRYLIDARHQLAGPGRDIDTCIGINARAAAAETLALDDATLADLMTALRVWLPRGLAGGQRNWSRRTLLSRSGLALVRFNAVRAQCCDDARHL
jgi:hypothetical protein